MAGLRTLLPALSLAAASSSSCGRGDTAAATDTVVAADTALATDSAAPDDTAAAPDVDDADGADGGGLTLTAGPTGSAVSGNYRDGDVVVRFSAAPAGAGAVATLRGEDDAVLATARILSATTAELELPGLTAPLSGHGALAAPDLAALRAFSATPEARAFARGLLELGCAVDSEDSAPARAALVFVWQLIIKHDAAFPRPEALDDGLACQYFGDARNVAASTPGAPEGLILADDDRLPWVAGFVPIDADGAVAALIPLSHDRAACGALCRGACGANCDPDACDVSTGADGCQHWSCGSHAGCRDHDACYDACNQSYGCNSVAAFACKHLSPDGCDELCLVAHGTTCFSWATGHGPFDEYLEFEHCGPATPCEGLAYFTFEDDVVVDCGVVYNECPGGVVYNAKCQNAGGGAMTCECLVDGQRVGGCVAPTSPPPDPIWCAGISFAGCCGFQP